MRATSNIIRTVSKSSFPGAVAYEMMRPGSLRMPARGVPDELLTRITCIEAPAICIKTPICNEENIE
jgi:hypothetical protein